MKKFLLLAACAFVYSAAPAQISIAPELGLNLSRIPVRIPDEQLTLEGRIKVGVRVGTNIEIPLDEHWSLQPGLFYSLKGTKRKMSFGQYSGYIEDDKENMTLHYGEIPLNIQYTFKPFKQGAFFAGIGAYFAFAFAGHYSYSTVSGQQGYLTTFDTSYDLRFGNDIQNSDIRRIDLGGQINLGFRLNNGIIFRAYFQQGFYNLVPQEDSNPSPGIAYPKSRARLNCFTFSIAKEFGKSLKKEATNKAGG